MTPRALVQRITSHDSVSYVLTNHIPRSLITRWVGWFSKIEFPIVRAASIAVWRFFCDVDLRDAKHARFKSLHDCFIRELKDGARPIDCRERVLVSPCDAIVGACGVIADDTLLQAKGMPYSLRELLRDEELASRLGNGRYITLRLTAGMYHRFHAPYDCTIDHVDYIAGDVFNVNPATLQRVANLFCKNERAVIRARLSRSDDVIALVPVAAVLVASIRLRFLDVLLHLRYGGPTRIACGHTARKGEELGWFEHGSTIVMLVPKDLALREDIHSGATVRMGQALFDRQQLHVE